jgi:DNA-binding transcriptional LysR family regulator
MSPAHALAKMGKVTLTRLGRETFVAHNVPSPLRQKVIEAFQRRKVPLQMEVELPSLEAIKRFVQRGNGVALVPRLTVEGELEAGTLVAVAVPELQIERKLRLVHRRQAALSHAAREFLRVVQAHAMEHGDPFCFVMEKG